MEMERGRDTLAFLGRDKDREDDRYAFPWKGDRDMKDRRFSDHKQGDTDRGTVWDHMVERGMVGSLSEGEGRKMMMKPWSEEGGRKMTERSWSVVGMRTMEMSSNEGGSKVMERQGESRTVWVAGLGEEMTDLIDR